MKKFVYLSILLVTFNAFSQVSEKSKNEKVKMVQKFLKTAKPNTGGNLTVLDILIDIEQKGGIEKSTIYDRNPEMWGVFLSDLENL